MIASTVIMISRSGHERVGGLQVGTPGSWWRATSPASVLLAAAVRRQLSAEPAEEAGNTSESSLDHQTADDFGDGSEIAERFRH